MPSAKPDQNEIRSLRKKRGLYFPSESSPNLFSGLYAECRTALEGGYINLERAQRLLGFLDQHETVAPLFPNTLLRRILQAMLTERPLSGETETTVLAFITDLYLGETPDERVPQRIGLVISADGVEALPTPSPDANPGLLRPPGLSLDFCWALCSGENPLFRDAFDLLFDAMPSHLDLADCFVAFTGAFQGFTRRTCYDEVRRRGGVPAEPDFFLDYLFVSEKNCQQRAISGQLSNAIYYRRIYGTPRILKESDWRALLGV